MDKFCISCEYKSIIWDRYETMFWACLRPVPKELDLVTGESSKPLGKPCKKERKRQRSLWTNKLQCGPHGIFYKPRV